MYMMSQHNDFLCITMHYVWHATTEWQLNITTHQGHHYACALGATPLLYEWAWMAN